MLKDEERAKALAESMGETFYDSAYATKRINALVAQVRLEEAKAIADHMDRYLDRDTRTMEIWLFVEERLAALEALAGREK